MTAGFWTLVRTVVMTFTIIVALGALALAWISQDRYRELKRDEQQHLDVTLGVVGVLKTQGQLIDQLTRSTRTNQQALNYLLGPRRRAARTRSLATSSP